MLRLRDSNQVSGFGMQPQLVKMSILAVALQQLGMRANFDDLARIHHGNAVSPLHGGQAVGNDQRGAG